MGLRKFRASCTSQHFGRELCWTLPLCLLLAATVFYTMIWQLPTASHYGAHDTKTDSRNSIKTSLAAPRKFIQNQAISHQPGAGKGSRNEKLSTNEEMSLDEIKQRLRKELLDYPVHSSLSVRDVFQLTPASGGRPVRNLVVTTWRSGSTFIGDILNTHPGTYYHYEPLLDFEIHRARNGKLADKARHYLNHLLTCNYTEMDDYVRYGKKHPWLFSHNTRLWSVGAAQNLLQNPQFLSQSCELFPFQVMKTVRLSMNLTEDVLMNKELDVRVLLLVRDPRATLQSRKHRDWCPGNPDCDDPGRLCEDLVGDYHEARRLAQLYPGKVRVIRYEDLSFNTDRITREVFDFFRLTYESHVDKFLQTHTKHKKGGLSSTFRDSKAAPIHWKNELSTFEVETIQSKCQRAMDLFGYTLAHSAEHLHQFDPVGTFNF